MKNNLKLKILIIHTQYLQFGGEDTTVKQEFALLKQTNEVDLLIFQNKKGWKGLILFLLSIWNVFAAEKVKKKIAEFQPDVVHLHNWHFASGPLIIRACKKMHVPIVMTIQNYRLLCPSALLLHNNILFVESLSQDFPWKAVRKKIYRNSLVQTFWLAFVIWLHKKIGTWQIINQFICLTPFAVEVYKTSTLGINPTKFTIKPNYTLPQDSKQIIKREQHFLFIGRLSEEKGVRLLIEAFQNSNHNLMIAGSGPLLNLVENKCNVFDNIKYIGNLNFSQVTNELKKCTALVFPSIWYEGMPLTILEALACSTPVIASNLGAMSSMIVNKHNGLHFTPNNVEDLKKQLSYWTDLPEAEKEQMRQSAFHTYKTSYSPDQQLAYFEVIYTNAINAVTTKT